MIGRDKRYSYVKPLVEAGKIKTLNDIFEVVPKTVVATDVGKRTTEFSELMNKVQKFTLELLFIIGSLCDLDDETIVRLAMNEYSQNGAKKGKA